MYGTGGNAVPALAVLQAVPDRLGYVERAARTGQHGGLVRSGWDGPPGPDCR
jgi:DNA polymerase-1